MPGRGWLGHSGDVRISKYFALPTMRSPGMALQVPLLLSFSVSIAGGSNVSARGNPRKMPEVEDKA